MIDMERAGDVMPIEWMFSKLGPTIRGVIALFLLGFVVYVVVTEYNARQVRRDLRDLAIEHNRATDAALQNQEVTKEFLDRDARRSEAILKVMTDMAKSMSDMTKLQNRILTAQPKPQPIKQRTTVKQRLKQCSVKGTRQTRIGQNTVVENVLIPIPCR